MRLCSCGDGLLVFLGEIAPSTHEGRQGLLVQVDRVEPGEVEPHLQVAQLGNGETRGTGVDALSEVASFFRDSSRIAREALDARIP